MANLSNSGQFSAVSRSYCTYSRYNYSGDQYRLSSKNRVITRRDHFAQNQVKIALLSILIVTAIISAGFVLPMQRSQSLAQTPLQAGYYSPEQLPDSRLLVLINSQYPLSAQINSAKSDPMLIAVSPSVSALSDSIVLHSSAMRAVAALIADARSAGVGSFYVGSGYRSETQQQQLYENAEDKSFVQPPGMSEHQTGLAVDLMLADEPRTRSSGVDPWLWLAENAWRYGLILRYPPDKQHITTIAGEPWHFRYVGYPHAWYCWQNNLCLEEYIDFLRSSKGYMVTLDGREYTVSYQTPVDGVIYIPDCTNCDISGDNTGGYIITIW
ncbi:MAG: M15 family metallopeptidase [Coriobacteriia bacterium]|nr:M15 family metallopeptidase [Coriobacteriia bacterium]